MAQNTVREKRSADEVKRFAERARASRQRLHSGTDSAETIQTDRDRDVDPPPAQRITDPERVERFA
ncbi:MAG: hypothetical protein OXN92_12465 [Gammaproteobacteria bacterium]|nr:hypothetical protein [Gammaproteobacteria bacterium]